MLLYDTLSDIQYGAIHDYGKEEAQMHDWHSFSVCWKREGNKLRIMGQFQCDEIEFMTQKVVF